MPLLRRPVGGAFAFIFYAEPSPRAISTCSQSCAAAFTSQRSRELRGRFSRPSSALPR
jgi:hypothetical protein